MTTKNKHWRMKVGATGFAVAPMLSFVPGKKQAYIWVGNDGKGDMRCFATLGDPETLRNLAKAILREVGEA